VDGETGMYQFSDEHSLGSPGARAARLPAGPTPAQTRAGGRLFGKFLSRLMPGIWRGAQPQSAPQVQARIRQLIAAGDPGAGRRLARQFFGTWRQGFWRNVRGDPAAMGALRAAGLRFPEEDPAIVAAVRARTGVQTPVEERLRRLAQRAPFYVDPSGRRMPVTLEHFRRLVEDPLRAFQESNLMLTTPWENSVFLEQLRRHLPPEWR
jgi:hypothetical protein